MSAANDSSFSSLSSSSLSSQTFPQIILASTSRYRHDLLSRLALPFEVMAPDYDEEIALEKFAKTPHFPDPCYLTAFFSLGKAQSVQRLQQAKHSVSFDSERSIIIGSDQVAFFQGEILGKPHTFEKAKQQLTKMAGQVHHLYTSMAIVQGKKIALHTDCTTLKMRPLSSAEIDSYLQLDQPLDCAGSYKLEAFGISLFDKIDCQDFTAIQGLPLISLHKILIKFSEISDDIT